MRFVRDLGLSLREAPCIDKEDSFPFYLATIHGYLEPDKYLHLESSKLPGYLLEATPENVSQGAGGFPAIVALGYAVSYLRFNQPRYIPPLEKPPFNLAKSYAVNLDFRKRRG